MAYRDHITYELPSRAERKFGTWKLCIVMPIVYCC